MTESRFVTKFITQLRKNYPGSYVVKIHGNAYTQRGVPDVIACIDGKFCAFELKVQKNRATKLQEYNMEMIERAGGVAQLIKEGGVMPWENPSTTEC